MRVLLANISQLKSDIQSCQCKTFSLKQASGLIGRSGGLDPLDTPPGSTTETYQNLSGFVTRMSNIEARAVGKTCQGTLATQVCSHLHAIFPIG